MLHPVVKGTSAALNQGMLAFTEGGFYQLDYVYMDDVNSSVEVFEKAVQKEYALRKQKREEFLERYRPISDVAELTERLLLADYYAERFRYTQQRIRRFYDQKQVDWQKETAACEALMPEVDALLADKIITSAHFRLIRNLTFYLRYRRAVTGDLGAGTCTPPLLGPALSADGRLLASSRSLFPLPVAWRCRYSRGGTVYGASAFADRQASGQSALH